MIKLFFISLFFISFGTSSDDVILNTVNVQKILNSNSFNKIDPPVFKVDTCRNYNQKAYKKTIKSLPLNGTGTAGLYRLNYKGMICPLVAIEEEISRIIKMSKADLLNEVYKNYKDLYLFGFEKIVASQKFLKPESFGVIDKVNFENLKLEIRNNFQMIVNIDLIAEVTQANIISTKGNLHNEIFRIKLKLYGLFVVLIICLLISYLIRPKSFSRLRFRKVKQ